MFSVGQKVVCISDQFAAWVFDLYKALPKKDSVYTIRAVRSGRSNPNFVVNDDAEIKMAGAEFDILVLLQELRNPDDPHSSVKQELGFRAERFAEMLEESEEWKDSVEVGNGELVPLNR
jgi:hypothetical protein